MFCQLMFGKRITKSNQMTKESGSAVSTISNDGVIYCVRDGCEVMLLGATDGIQGVGIPCLNDAQR